MPARGHARRRRIAASVAALAVAGGVAGTVAAGGGAADAGGGDRLADGCASSPVLLGVVLPDGAAASARSAAQRLTAGTEEDLGCPVRLVVRPTQADLVTDVALHRVDVAQLDPVAAVVAERVTGAAVVGAFADDASTPSVTTQAAVVTRRGSTVRRLSDLRGRSIALGPRLTGVRDVVPRRALLAAGVVPGRDVRIERTTSSAQALALVRRGGADAAVVSIAADRALTRDGTSAPPSSASLAAAAGWTSPADLSRVRRIATLQAVPADVFVMRPNIPAAIRRQIGPAVRGIDPADLAPQAAHQGVALPAPLLAVSLDLYGGLADDLDALTAAGVAP